MKVILHIKMETYSQIWVEKDLVKKWGVIFYNFEQNPREFAGFVITRTTIPEDIKFRDIWNVFISQDGKVVIKMEMKIAKNQLRHFTVWGVDQEVVNEFLTMVDVVGLNI